MPHLTSSARPELDLDRFELRIEGSPVRLEKIPMELLVFLVERRDELVKRQEIVDRLWGPNVYLDSEQGINTAVRKVRQALGDDPVSLNLCKLWSVRVIGSLVRSPSSQTVITKHDLVLSL
jgi:DNA-binding response OmpR family regulator